MTKLQQHFAKLPTWEIAFYAIVWIAAVFYSIYSVYLVTNDFFDDHFQDYYHEFETGWSFLQRKVDSSDYEWNILIRFTFELAPWVLVQVVISQHLKLLCHNTVLLCLWYISVSTAFLWYYFGLPVVLFVLLFPLTSCLLTLLRSKTICWITNCTILFLISWPKAEQIIFVELLHLQIEENYVLHFASAWLILRNISYCIDSIENDKHYNASEFLRDLLQNIAYCLYLPPLFLGPVILYKKFTDGLNEPFTKWDRTKTLNILGKIARYLFWMFFTQLSLHFVYFNALRYRPAWVDTLRPWAFYGYGYCMGQYFCNKYVVYYGLTCTVSRAEDIDAPPAPKCIGRIHLYSDMWKYFDHGLYLFLLRYIYIPLNAKTGWGKFVSSVICFSFVYFWHGLQYYIFIWSFLNFTGVMIEMIAKSFSSYFYKNILRDCLSLSFKRRLECALASPLLAFSAVSNFYFFAGTEIGHKFASRTLFLDSWRVRIILLFILYCWCQVSTEVKQFEQVKITKRKEASKEKLKKAN